MFIKRRLLKRLRPNPHCALSPSPLHTDSSVTLHQVFLQLIDTLRLARDDFTTLSRRLHATDVHLPQTLASLASTTDPDLTRYWNDFNQRNCEKGNNIQAVS